MVAWKCVVPLLGSISILSCHAAKLEQAPSLASGATVIPQAYMVEFEDGYNIESFYDDLEAQDVKFSPRLNITYSLFKGCSFELDKASSAESTTRQIGKMPMVKRFWPITSTRAFDPPSEADETITASSFQSFLARRQSTNDTYPPHRMTQVNRLQAAGITGKGIKVAVIDSGVDYTHPALGGCFGTGCLVGYGYNFFGRPSTADPIDCNGHGSHVAGIIAARPNPFGFTGAAPGVTIGAYRASTCSGSISDDFIVAAFNRAFDDGSNIINLSSVSPFDWPEHPVSVAVQRIVARGVPCIASMGNDGRKGLWSSGSPAVGHGVSAIANFINEETPHIHSFASYSVDSNSSAPDTFTWQPGTPPFPDVALPVKLITFNEACDELPADDLSGFIVLVRESPEPVSQWCHIRSKLAKIFQKGGLYVMVHSLTDTTDIVVSGSVETTIQGVGTVSAAQGDEWLSLMNSGHSVILHMVNSGTAPQVIYAPKNAATGGLVHEHSSWGLTWELDVKPQFGGPGQNILSTYMVSKGSYKVLSGTSMSAPFVTAVYALLAEARGTLDPATLQNLLAATAKPNVWYDASAGQAHDILAPVSQQGAGLVQAYDAAFTKTLLSVSSLAFNDSDHHVSNISFSIKNTGDQVVTYHLGHVKAATVYSSAHSYIPDPAAFEFQDVPGQFQPGLETADAWATLGFSTENVVLAAGSSAIVTVTPTPPAGLDAGRLPVYSGYIAINASSGESLSLPYAGVAGSMYNAPVLNFNSTSHYLAHWDRLMGEGDPALPANVTFTVPRPIGEPNDESYPERDVPLPSATFYRSLGSRYVRLDIIPLEVNGELETTEVLGVRIAGSAERYPQFFLPGRGGEEAPFTGMLADGRVVPEGRYRHMMRALKVFGDQENPADYDVLTTPPFILKYQA
ncbi:peptidase S8/S53 domain-containing protein [Podospora didyma]|uniref:Peptidase S8/S53 domain-containing protein n=1 Tax=Podospora didyma TaxID=330526 RepID=A0AAE0NHY7_9PEZI|nr:peptidase S8/S53 domain-containing protein [Podospora didyma]